MPKLPLPAGLRKPPKPGEGGTNGARRNGAAADDAKQPSPAVEAVKEGAIDVVGWVDERTGASPFLTGMLFRKVPKGTNWFYTLGSATLFAFAMQALTGVFLAMYYVPSTTEAYNSITHLTNDVFLGEFVRGMHKWGATVMIDPDLPAHGQDLLLRRLQVPARAQLGDRRRAADPHPGDGPDRLPAAVRPALLLGDDRGDEHHRLRPGRGSRTSPTSCAPAPSSAAPRCRASTPSTCCSCRG